jgi:hypothetical protein
MKTPARLFPLLALALMVCTPCWGFIAVTWLDDPIELWSPLPAVYESIDIDGNSIVDFTFGASVSFVGIRAEGDNHYLVWPNPPPTSGGNPEPLLDGFEIGPNSGEGDLDWFGINTDFSTLIRCLSGSGGYTCAGRFMGQHAYMGIEFDIEGARHYGWIDLLVASDNPYAEIYGWGYETDPGVSILAGAGAVPEPSTISLLIGGLLTIGCTLRRAKARRG